MRAHLLSIGTELLLGHLTDTNATFLAQEFAANGIELLHVTHVGDDLPRLAATIRHALTDANVVICTGGVGPTDDDLTREAIAAVVGEVPTVEPSLLDEVRAFFMGRGLTMPDRNAKQAWLIPSAEPLPNPVGTAPGWFVRHEGRAIAAMPGVPREMHRMWRDQLLPRLQPLLAARAVRSVTLKTIGIGESAAEQLLDDLVKVPNPSVATYAKDDGVHVRVTAVAASPADAVELLTATVDDVRRRLSRYVYADDETSLPSALDRLLTSSHLTLAIAEQGTAGRIGALLLSDPPLGSAVTGSMSLPLVTPPIQSVTQLAEKARDHFGSTLGLGARINPSPEGPATASSIDIAITGTQSAEESFPFRLPLPETQRRAALMAADVLRRALLAEA